MLTDVYSAIIDAHKQVLSISCNTIMRRIVHMQQYASSVVFQSQGEARVTWSRDFKVAVIDGKVLGLQDLQEGLKVLIRQTWDMIY